MLKENTPKQTSKAFAVYSFSFRKLEKFTLVKSRAEKMKLFLKTDVITEQIGIKEVKDDKSLKYMQVNLVLN